MVLKKSWFHRKKKRFREIIAEWIACSIGLQNTTGRRGGGYIKKGFFFL